jgi:hypothetical protein
VVDAIAALASDEGALGATVQLADPEPLTTHDLFDTIARALAGRGSRIMLPPVIVRSTLFLPLSPKLTGLPHAGVPYFFLSQMYDTTQARHLLEPHGIRCPRFSDYAPTLVEFVGRHPRLSTSAPFPARQRSA